MSGSLDEAIQGLRDTQWTTMLNAGAFSLYAYDTILVFPYEYKYVWRARLNQGKVLYLLIRYGGLLSSIFWVIDAFSPDPSASYCRIGFIIEAYGGLLLYVPIFIVFAIRTYVIWERNQTIWYILVSMAVLAPATMVGFIVWSQDKYVWLPNPMPGVWVGCYQVCAACQVWNPAFYIPPMIFDTVVFVLTIWKVYDLSTDDMVSPLLRLVYRDGFLYFIAIFATTLVNLVIWNVARPSLLQIFLGYHRSLLPIMACRLLLNLRGSTTRPNIQGANHDSSYPMSSMSTSNEDRDAISTTIRFAPAGTTSTQQESKRLEI